MALINSEDFYYLLYKSSLNKDVQIISLIENIVEQALVLDLDHTDIDKLRKDAVLEFVDELQKEISNALDSNFKAKAERLQRIASINTSYNNDDELINIIDGKISALEGISFFIKEAI